MPSGFESKMMKKSKGDNSKPKERRAVYQRDIILLPSSYMKKDSMGKVPIPRGEREFLAAKCLIGKPIVQCSKMLKFAQLQLSLSSLKIRKVTTTK